MKRKNFETRRWLEAYLKTGNLTQATIAAGYKVGSKSGKVQSPRPAVFGHTVGTINDDCSANGSHSPEKLKIAIRPY